MKALALYFKISLNYNWSDAMVSLSVQLYWCSPEAGPSDRSWARVRGALSVPR